MRYPSGGTLVRTEMDSIIAEAQVEANYTLDCCTADAVRIVAVKADWVDRRRIAPATTVEEKVHLVAGIVSTLVNSKILTDPRAIHCGVLILCKTAKRYGLHLDHHALLDYRTEGGQALIMALDPDNTCKQRDRAAGVLWAALGPRIIRRNWKSGLSCAIRRFVCMDQLHDLTSEPGRLYAVGLQLDDHDMIRAGIDAARHRSGVATSTNDTHGQTRRSTGR